MSISTLQATQNFDLIALLMTSLVLIVSMSWNQLIQKSLDETFPDKSKSLSAQTLYTVSLTMFVAFLSNYVFKYSTQIVTYLKYFFSRGN